MYQFIYFPSGDTWILALFCVLSRGQSEKAIIQIHMGTIFFNQLTKKKKKGETATKPQEATRSEKEWK